MDTRKADPGATDAAAPSATPASDEVLWPAGFAAFIKLGVLYQKASRCLARDLRGINLTVAQFDALANLYQHDGVPQNELARRLLVTKGNMTGLVRRLEERDLLERRPDPQDARVHQLYLTEEGRAVAKNALVLQRDLRGHAVDLHRNGLL
ncbi:MAG: MarR family transcriptional regulator, partial [Myxococcota bacterium]